MNDENSWIDGFLDRPTNNGISDDWPKMIHGAGGGISLGEENGP